MGLLVARSSASCCLVYWCRSSNVETVWFSVRGGGAHEVVVLGCSLLEGERPLPVVVVVVVAKLEAKGGATDGFWGGEFSCVARGLVLVDA